MTRTWMIGNSARLKCNSVKLIGRLIGNRGRPIEIWRKWRLSIQQSQLLLDKSKTESKVFKLKQYGDAIRNSVTKMTEHSPLDFLPFIAKFENLLTELSVPGILWVTLMTPYLSERCRTLVNRLQGGRCNLLWICEAISNGAAASCAVLLYQWV